MRGWGAGCNKRTTHAKEYYNFINPETIHLSLRFCDSKCHGITVTACLSEGLVLTYTGTGCNK